MVPKIITPPAAELLTLEECRDQLGVQPYEFDSDGNGSHPHDAMIMRMQAQARAYCETFTGLSLAQKTLELALDRFPTAEIELPPPVVEIVSVKYVDADQNEVTIDAADYTLDDYQKPAWLLPATDAPWPTAGTFVNAVKIRFVAGYRGPEETSDTIGEAIPEDLLNAVIVRTAYLYANREGSPDGAQAANHDRAMESLLRPWRVRLGMA